MRHMTIVETAKSAHFILPSLFGFVSIAAGRGIRLLFAVSCYLRSTCLFLNDIVPLTLAKVQDVTHNFVLHRNGAQPSTCLQMAEI